MQLVIPDRRHAPRPGACCAIAAILLIAGNGLPTAVLAQSRSLPQTDTQGLMPAPIGHRQPRAQDLPPDVLRDEGMTRQPPEPAPPTLPGASRDQGDRRDLGMPFVGNDLQICRQC
jgi:hypothetical protein